MTLQLAPIKPRLICEGQDRQEDGPCPVPAHFTARYGHGHYNRYCAYHARLAATMTPQPRAVIEDERKPL